MEQADSPGTGESACCVLQVKRFPHYTIPFCSVLTHPLLQSIYKMYSAITKRDKKIQIFHPWEIFLLQTRLSKACKKIAVLPCDVWTNRSKEWADVNVKPFYKACFNHNTCFFLLLKKEKSYLSYKFSFFKDSFSALIFITNHTKTLSCECLITLSKYLFFEETKDQRSDASSACCNSVWHITLNLCSAPKTRQSLLFLWEKNKNKNQSLAASQALE